MRRYCSPALVLLAFMFVTACGQPSQGGGASGGAAPIATAPTVAALTPTTPPTAVSMPTATLGPTAAPEKTAPATGAPEPTAMPEATPTIGAEATVKNPGEKRAVEAARRALARKLHVDPTNIKLVSVATKQWSDASLGCPEKGKMYAQVITPGYLVVLDSGGKNYDVHTSKQGNAVVCEQKASAEPSKQETVATLTRSGGFAGLTQTVVLYADGTVKVFNGGKNDDLIATTAMPKARVEQLRASIASAEWQRLDDSYGRQQPDGYQYTITDGGKQVTTYDGAKYPSVLGEVLGTLNSIRPATPPKRAP